MSISICRQCGVLSTEHTPHQVCSGCKYARYCNRDCQKAHWKIHKPRCEERRNMYSNAVYGAVFKEWSRWADQQYHVFHGLVEAVGSRNGGLGPTFVITDMEIDYIATNSNETKFQVKESDFTVIRLDVLKKSLQDCVVEKPGIYSSTDSPAGLAISQIDEEVRKYGDGIKGFIRYHCRDLLNNQLRVLTFLHSWQGAPMQQLDPKIIVSLINSGLLHVKNLKKAVEEESKAGGGGGCEEGEG